jgi:hypothetical protein
MEQSGVAIEQSKTLKKFRKDHASGRSLFSNLDVSVCA